MSCIGAVVKLDSNGLFILIFIDDLECKFRAKIESKVVVLVEHCDTVFVDKNLSGSFIVQKVIFEEEIGVDCLCEVFFDVHWRIQKNLCS
jgi:hypothetical protein